MAETEAASEGTNATTLSSERSTSRNRGAGPKKTEWKMNGEREREKETSEIRCIVGGCFTVPMPRLHATISEACAATSVHFGEGNPAIEK
jgi:hypothetical protein